MSLWIPGRKKNGRRSLTSVSFSTIAIVIMLGILFSLGLRILAWLREMSQ